jgi:hypothetical protein
MVLDSYRNSWPCSPLSAPASLQCPISMWHSTRHRLGSLNLRVHIYTVMDPILNVLCDSCSGMSFTLHDPKACKLFDCHYDAKEEAVSSISRRRESLDDTNHHSEILVHSPNLAVVEASAQKGCHLCALLLFALDHSRADLSTEFSSGKCQPGAVALLFVNVAYKNSLPEQELFVLCGNRKSVLSVANVPLSKFGCSGMYLGTAWGISRDPKVPICRETETKFYARCVDGRSPHILRRDGQAPETKIEAIDGLPRLINYLPGQVSAR